MKITFSDSREMPREGCLVAAVVKDGELPAALRELDEMSGGQLSRAMKAASFDGAKGSVVDIPAPHGIGLDRLLLVGAGRAEDLDAWGVECLGGRMAGALMERKQTEASVLALPPEGLEMPATDWAVGITSGMALRNYVFDRYKSEKKDGEEAENGKKNGKRIAAVTVLAEDPQSAEKAWRERAGLVEAVHMARDLVNEPGNVLNPAEFARRVKELEKLGLEVEILDEKELEKLGFGALLAVGQGSANAPCVAVMKWNGGKDGEAPVAFVGKGVTFDSGGISIKPSQGMEDMKGDMGGAAAVTGVMRALAARKAKVNAVGIIGLVENMPDGRAQRPGDVVKSLSGQTIAVLNTDAEGRLVLADCLTYARDTFKPALMIDLATLTGAILVALGKEYAGLFSNDDDLSEALRKAGENTGEKVWRLPLGKAYDKLIDHDVADMKNIGGRNAGSITAAQFLKRFVEDTPWAHIDVAGTAMAAEKSDINTSWGPGWGVRLLDAFVRDREEG